MCSLEHKLNEDLASEFQKLNLVFIIIFLVCVKINTPKIEKILLTGSMARVYYRFILNLVNK